MNSDIIDKVNTNKYSLKGKNPKKTSIKQKTVPLISNITNNKILSNTSKKKIEILFGYNCKKKIEIPNKKTKKTQIKEEHQF